ncbi:MAG: DNA-binding protein [Magnetococcales bacterium]|nr:DNA-binding protein [Magnetococcales bacterium]
MLHEVHLQKYFMGRLNHGDDLLGVLTQTCQDLKISLGHIQAIGAVQKAVLGYYHQEQKSYHTIDLDQHLEIVQLTGNISLKDAVPFVHAHLTLSDPSGRTYGGHLFPGTLIFACEVFIHAVQGPTFERTLDATTGLPLWRVP